MAQRQHNSKPPAPVSLQPKVAAADNWKLWKELYENYSVISNLDNENRRFQRAFLISTMGMEALQLYNSDNPNAGDSAADIIRKLDVLILGQTNETFERYKFNTRSQRPEESIDAYVVALKVLSRSCGFCNCMRESLIRDRIILGVSDESLRKELLHERNLTLTQCIDASKAFESTTSQLRVLSESATQPVNKVSKSHNSSKRRPESYEIDCLYCGNRHARKKEKCPAWGKTCSLCKTHNHFAVCCPKKKEKKKKKVHQVQCDNSSSADEDDLCDGINSVADICSVKHGPIYAEMKVQKRKITFQVDCGATVNVISRSKIGSAELRPTSTILRMYNKAFVYPVGKCNLIVGNPSNCDHYEQVFQVVDRELVPLLSRSAAEKMNLITVNYSNFKQVNSVSVTDTYKSVFEVTTLGKLPGNVHLYVDEGQPVQCPPRRIPVAIKKPLQKELETMVQMGVIVPETEPSAWCSQISVQKKRT